MSKVFIIGLPRTGTTSISVALLEMGLSVAHTAFTKKAFELADAVSDAPCFSDYKQLDQLFPNSKFIYLSRKMERWLPSISMLLDKMAPHLAPKTGKFSPILKRSFHHTFSPTLPLSGDELMACYRRHELGVQAYFKGRDDLLTIDVSEPGSLLQIKQFLGMPSAGDVDFPKLNAGRQVTAWKEYKHPNKINSHQAGVEHKKYFDYVLADEHK
ncbi:sulfotransferase [Motilimonas sp. 1_MG-2023]|uniref:sulfotransferase family protein n=1 Tax=Motilimonas sp. 1_MG-2023 TaxID=3062672 RepID=UPI0026E45335|nr:sulfotransferase family protein [Motilimonas sp. 1_MG-2023]MDO6525066.1 sulfotransferase [Motilimonas sp. 1_MG-2023]